MQSLGGVEGRCDVDKEKIGMKKQHKRKIITKRRRK
jgi:hypothetical protein